MSELEKEIAAYRKPFEKLQKWATENEPGDNMIWKPSYWDQIIFVRDQLRHCLDKGFKVDVISTHTSKSIVLPVYEIKYKGHRFIIRYNFFNWIISAIMKKPLTIDFGNLFDKDSKSGWAEGFQDSWLFESYSKNKKKFTIEMQDRYEVYTFFWLIRNYPE